MGQTGRRQVDCSRVVGQQQQKSDRRQWHAATGERRVDWRSTSAAGLDVSSADQRRTAAGLTSTAVQCREELSRELPPVWTWCARVTVGCSQPVKTGESICNMLRATKTGDRPSCCVEDRLETVKQWTGIRWQSDKRVMVLRWSMCWCEHGKAKSTYCSLKRDVCKNSSAVDCSSRQLPVAKLVSAWGYRPNSYCSTHRRLGMTAGRRLYLRI